MPEPTVAVLFARADSHYKAIAGCDVYDIERDARTYAGPHPVIAHPPCRAWGLLRQFAKPRHDEKALAPWAIEQVRRFGGVLEHPAGSTLWPTLGLPEPGAGRDQFDGWTLGIHQHWWGHRAEKATRLYIVGCPPQSIPAIPMRLDKPTHCIRPTKSYPRLPSVTKAEREHTPTALAEWIVELAKRCQPSASCDFEVVHQVNRRPVFIGGARECQIVPVQIMRTRDLFNDDSHLDDSSGVIATP